MWLCISFHDRVFRDQVSSIVDTSHFLEVQVTLGCFLCGPQIIAVQMPQFAQSSSGHNGARAALASPSTTPFMCVPRSLYIDMSPIVSADALTKPYKSASAELRATTACVCTTFRGEEILQRRILLLCCGVFFCNLPNLCLRTFQVGTAFLEICTTTEPWVCFFKYLPNLTIFSQYAVAM